MKVVFILIDTLRADHLGCYGYPRPTSPVIDQIATEGIVFDNCFAPGIPTTPAHTTIYTGMHPISHNIVAHGGSVDLDRKIPVLPELLQRAGVTTCAVDNLYDIKPWLSRGYEYYINPSHRHKLRLLVSCEEINRRAVPWIQANANEDFFLFLHYWEPHTPYLPPMKYRQFWDGGDPCDPANHSLDAMRDTPFWGMWGDTWFKKLGPITDADYVRSLYDGEIRHADEGIGAIAETLELCGIADDTLLIVTADHGEVMDRNGIYFDHHGLYDENIRVPLIMRWPNRLPRGERRGHFVEETDLAPTLLEWAGASPVSSMDGMSLSSIAMDNGAPSVRDRIIACECTWQAKWCLRNRTHKLILSREQDAYGTPMRELYNLQRDASESVNLAEQDTVLANEMEVELEAWIASELTRLGRPGDPLVEQGISLGKRWETWRGRAAAMR